MKKSLTILLLLIISLVFVTLVSGEVRINEVELDPYDDCLDCTEWLELYSDNEINLSGWEIRDLSNNTLELDFIINGYDILENISVSLNNDNEQLFLYNGTDLIFETPEIDDSDNDDKTWQYCDGNWNFTDSTKGSENSCGDEENGDENGEPSISLSMDWNEDDIVNGKEFEIDVKAENLNESKNYDVKVWIEFEDNDTKISQTYDENEEWVSSNQYYDEFFKEEINETKDITLRMHEDYENYYGDARIYLRIREVNSSGYIEEIEKYIKILEKEEDEKDKSNDEDNKQETTSNNPSSPTITGEVIKLGSSKENSEESEDIKTNKNIIYESKSEKIKKYAVFGFALLCVGLSVLLIFKKIK